MVMLLLLDGMELQLGLALPSNPIKGFDLNSYGYEPRDVLGSDTLSHQDYNLKKKRCFDEAFDTVDVPQTLPLLFSWGNQPNDEDDPKDLDKNSIIIDKNEDENGVIGWPPIKTCRKKFCYQIYGGRAANNWMVENGGAGGGGRRSNSMYVKVKMEGVAIARKVDLSLHHSYQTLTDTLLDMFGKCQEHVKAYKLTYQDREGDWMLAGDAPWETFIRSVQRLKLIKNNG